MTFDTGADAGTQRTLTFTTTNWSTAQTVTVRAAQDDDEAADSATLVHTAAGGGYGAYRASLEVSVTDDDTGTPQEPVVTVSASATSIEEGAAVTLTFTASPAPAADTGVSYTVAGGTAFGLETGARTATIAAGETTAEAVLQTRPDRVANTDATVTVALSDPTVTGEPYRLGGAVRAAVRVTQSAAPTVTLAAAPATITEGEAVTLTFTADKAPSSALAVKYTIAGGTSYGLPAGTQQTATVAAGRTVATVVHRTAPDGRATANDETIAFSLDPSVSAAGAAYERGSPSAVDVTVRQDTAAPALSTAAVSGAILTLTYDEALDSGSVPAPGAFTVEVGGTPVALADSGAVAVSGRAVTLTLASAVAAGQAVTVSYAVPAANPIKDRAGNAAAGFDDEAVSVGPAVRNVGIVAPASGDTFGVGETIEVQVQYNSRLTIAGTPRLALTVGEATRYAAFSPGDSLLNTFHGVAVVAFTYRVQLGDHDADGIGVAGPVELDGGAIRGRLDEDGNPLDLRGDAALSLAGHVIAAGYKVDGRTDVIEVAMTNFPASGDTYRAGETVEVGVTLGTRAQVVTANGAPKPRLALTIGEATRHAAFTGDSTISGTTVLTFRYTVQAGDIDSDGISVPANAIDLNGAVLRDDDGNALALTLAHAALPAQGGHKVDGGPGARETTAPTLSAAAVTGAALTLTYDEALDPDSVPAAGAFAVTAGGARVPVSGVAVAGSAVTLTLASPAAAGQAVTVGYTRPGANPIRDLAGNRAASFAARAAANGTVVAPGIVVSAPQPSPVPEGGSATYTVVLTKKPSGTVSIVLASDNPDVVVRPALVQLVPNEGHRLGWSTPQVVTVWAAQDADAADEEATITHRVRGGSAAEYGRLAAVTLTVEVKDDDVEVSVADARAREAPGATLRFRVTLDEAASRPVGVDYATADGTAVAGEDYTETRGTLYFAVGETRKTVSVPVLDDAHDEGTETMTLRLSNPSFGLAIGDGEATGTIINSDPAQKAWIARFGRTVADQAIEAVDARMQAPRTAGNGGHPGRPAHRARRPGRGR